MSVIDDRTPVLGLPLPSRENDLADDVARIRDSFSGIDAAIGKQRQDISGLASGLLDALGQASAAHGAADAAQGAAGVAQDAADAAQGAADAAALAAGVADGKAEAAQTAANEAKQAAADAAKGSAVVLGPPTVGIRSKIATGRPTDITLAPPTVMLLGGAIATYHIVVDDAPAVDVAATGNPVTYSFTPGKPAGSTVRVSVTATDSLGNRSLPREVVADMVDGYVVTPTILSPAAGTRLKMRQFPVATSAFASYGVTDTHLSTDWMATSDLDRTEVLHQAIGSTDLTAHNVPGISVAADMPVYLWARHNGHDVGPSDWAHIAVVATPSRHGEILKDSAGQPAAVVVGSLASNGELPWNIRGRRVWIAVALASKRGVDQSWNLSQSDSNYVDIATIENPTNNWQLAANNTGADGTGQYVSSLSTEAHMDASFAFSSTVKNSKELTSAILAHNANYMAAKFCRAVSLADGFGAMDLPSIDVLMRIYQARTVIDSLDSTATANAAKKLTAWGFGSADGAYVWSASEYDSTSAWYVNSGGALYGNGKNGRFGCVPALEIPA